MRPCACTHDGWDPAILAGTDNPPEPARSDYYAPVLGGELTGGVQEPTGLERTSTPPPAPAAALPPQRPARHRSRRVALIRFVADFPLQRGNHADIERQVARPTATQLPVELRGSIYRAAPDNQDPAWSEVVASAVSR